MIIFSSPKDKVIVKVDFITILVFLTGIINVLFFVLALLQNL